jgi:hypothetical protein
MAFEIVSGLVTERYAEVQNLLNYISASERPIGSAEPEAQSVHILRGLFFVALYGAWEYSITRALIQLYSAINACGVQHRHVENIVGSVTLDGLFRSLGDTAATRQWERRFDLLIRQNGSDIVEIDDNIFMFDVQFLKIRVIERIFGALGITESPVPVLAYRGLIDEVAERRSAVAHGRESPVAVGSQFRSDELRRRYAALSSTSFYIIGIFENLLASKTFIRAPERHLYI